MSVYESGKMCEFQQETRENFGRVSSKHSCCLALGSTSTEGSQSSSVHEHLRRCRRTSSALNGSLHSRSLLWLLVLAIGILSQATFSEAQEAVTIFLSSDAGPPPLNVRECIEMFDNTYQARYICRDHQDMVPLLRYAESLAKAECEKQFEKELWNCSGFSLLRTPKINTGSKVYKEGAYVDALSVAAIAHTIAKACSDGLLKSCTCNDEDETLPTDTNLVSFEQGCSDNIDYGLEVAESFMNHRFTGIGRNLKQELVQHNYRVAKEVINKIYGEVRPTCSCIGVSGSCTLQACQSTLPEFEVIGSELRKKFEEGCEVRANGHSNNAWISECGREYTNKDLIYRNNYDWCVADSSIGAPGVVGRRCDPNTTGPGSCESLCRACNRRPQQHEEQYEYQCNCHFVFCCEIRCSICEGEKTYYTCE